MCAINWVYNLVIICFSIICFTGVKTISNIVAETCQAIYDVLKDEHMKVPSSTEEWESIAADYLARWNYPNCLGSLDGKHIVSHKSVKI